MGEELGVAARRPLDACADRVTLTSERLKVRCWPAQGAVIESLQDSSSGAEALWRWPRVAAAPCRRELGPGGELSVATFVDRFVGGWFTMFPAVGFPEEGDPVSLLHGEVVRLPWQVVRVDGASADLFVETLRSPFAVHRRLEVVGGELRVEDRVENVGYESAPYAFGHHPCLSRETFAGGTLELDVERAEVPAPPYDAAASRLAEGPVTWPHGRLRTGEAVDLATVPAAADGRVDHVCVRPARGHARITAPSVGRALVLTWDVDALPELLLWQNLRGLGGWPFWGAADTFALEPSSVPGRSMGEARVAGAVRWLAPGAVFEMAMSARWEGL